MNKIMLLGCFIMLFSIVSYAQNRKRQTAFDIYLAYNQTKLNQHMEAFFKEFPNSFNEFQSIYGYDDVKGESPNYQVAFDHINLFFKTASVIDKRKFSEKLVDITLHGKWNADAENYFQHNLRSYYFAHTHAIIDILRHRAPMDVDQFWYFFCDGPSFDKGIDRKVQSTLTTYPQIKKSFVKMAELARKNNKE